MLPVFFDARAAAPASALYAWADSCPATAIAAGIYGTTAEQDGGVAVEELVVANQRVFRVRRRAPVETAGRPTLAMRENIWKIGPDCRAVGLVSQGNDLGTLWTTGFVVAKDGGTPSAAEQALLLDWAGYLAWDPTRPGHAVATAAFAPPPAGEPPGHGLSGVLYRQSARTWNAGPVPAQADAWRSAARGPDGASCPCWEVARAGAPGQTPRGDWIAHGYLAGVTLLEDPVGRRWALEARRPYGGKPIEGTAPAALAGLEALSWNGPGTGKGTVAVIDPASGALFVLTLDGGGPFAWTADGLALGGGKRLDASTLRGWLKP